jgi:hypothetical protein
MILAKGPAAKKYGMSPILDLQNIYPNLRYVTVQYRVPVLGKISCFK